MKKCPVCDKTFEDSMRFCQVDGTPLIDDEPPLDPYATIVARREDIIPEAPVETASAPVEEEVAAPHEEPPVAEAETPAEVEMSPEPDASSLVNSGPIAAPEEVLDLPEAMDPLKTMFVSEAELKAAFSEEEKAEPAPAAEPVVEPAVEESPAPEQPSFSVPDVPAPSFGDLAPPPSPFSVSESIPEEPAPPPFSVPESVPEEPAPAPPPFAEPETVIQPAVSSPFEEPTSEPVAEWTPPPAPDAARKDQEIASNTPFQPPPAGVAGQSKGLAVGSTVCGVLSCLCCMSLLTGPAAIVMGFIAKKRADENPSEFGGRGLALAGLITGGLGVLVGIGQIVWILFFGGLNMLFH